MRINHKFLPNSTHPSIATPTQTDEVYPRAYWPGDTAFDHLEFALKREGLHLQLLRTLLPRLAADQLAAYIRSKPTSAYARRVWFLFEQFSSQQLPLPDVTQGNYVDLLDSREYYTGPITRSQRHRVNINLLGSLTFSPMVRRTKLLKAAECKQLEQQCRKVIEGIPPELYARALQFLYTKETKSSYAIERETPDQKRSQKFAEALRDAAKRDYLLQTALISFQQTIVDPRFANNGWRDTLNEQNYVGRSVSPTEEEVHFIPPRPQDLAELMPAYLEASRRILHSNTHPVIAAAVIAYPLFSCTPSPMATGVCIAS